MAKIINVVNNPTIMIGMNNEIIKFIHDQLAATIKHPDEWTNNIIKQLEKAIVESQFPRLYNPDQSL